MPYSRHLESVCFVYFNCSLRSGEVARWAYRIFAEVNKDPTKLFQFLVWFEIHIWEYLIIFMF